MFDDIERFYNWRRSHAYLDQVTPMEYEVSKTLSAEKQEIPRPPGNGSRGIVANC